jgi:hypothetical protein
LVKPAAALLGVAVVNFAAEVGPEFLGEVAECVEQNVGAPDGHGVAGGVDRSAAGKNEGAEAVHRARDDANDDGLRLPKIRANYEKAVGPKELVILDGSAHAQFLFATDQGERLMREILRFFTER